MKESRICFIVSSFANSNEKKLILQKKKNYAITTYHIFIESISSIERFRVTDLIKRLINVKTISTRKNIYNTKEKKL